jgi:hypothetical protein
MAEHKKKDISHWKSWHGTGTKIWLGLNEFAPNQDFITNHGRGPNKHHLTLLIHRRKY